jgi:hypothetical protein
MPAVPTAPFYSTAPYNASLTATSTANLPNRSGSATTIAGLQVGQICQVGAQYYACYDPTSGSAIWYLLGQPKDPQGFDRIQTVSTATATIGPGIDRVIVTYAAGACTLTFSTVLAGHPIGTSFVVEKANTSANGIVITPDSGASINGGAADATQAMVGANATASTTVSAAGTNDISARFVRNGALTWRSSIC